MYFLVYWKLQQNYEKIARSTKMYLNNKSKFVISHNKICNFLQVPTYLIKLQNYVFMNVLHFPITPTFGQSPSHHQHESTKLNKNSKFKSPMSNDLSLSIMPYKSKNNVVYLLF